MPNRDQRLVAVVPTVYQDIELVLRPPLCLEERFTQDDGASRRMSQPHFDLNSETLTRLQFVLIEPDLETSPVQHRCERLAHFGFILKGVTYEDIPGHPYTV
jgi:hypothetical protein